MTRIANDHNPDHRTYRDPANGTLQCIDCQEAALDRAQARRREYQRRLRQRKSGERTEYMRAYRQQRKAEAAEAAS